MSIEFDPESSSTWGSGELPAVPVETELRDALAEIRPVVAELSADISGVGRKAAERYLLRYQYGFSPSELAEAFDVAPQTVSTQISGVREKVLKYPRLARIIGTLRSHRAALQQPEWADGATSSGRVPLNDEQVEYTLTYKNGSVGRPYSWQYNVTATYQRDDCEYHLNRAYLVDEIHGVLLKRMHRSVSLVSWTQPRHMYEYNYDIFPLPNVEVPTEDGTLLAAVEHHTAHDIKTKFERLIAGVNDWEDLEEEIREGAPQHRPPSITRQDVLLDRIRRCQGETPVEEYTELRHIRQNLERIMRTYPLNSPWDLPPETITQLWNGHPTNREDHTDFWLLNKQDLYDLVDTVRSRHNGRDFYLTDKDTVEHTHIW